MSTQPSPVDEADLRTRLATLTLEQKVELLTGRDFWALNDAPAAGLRRMVVSDGPAGVRGERWDERDPSANVPIPDRARRHLGRGAGRAHRPPAGGRVAGARASTSSSRRRSTCTAARYGGRHFECLSEDPFLTGRIGDGYVQGVQSGGVGATVKHFVGNDSETDRFTVDARIDERTLRELYLAPSRRSSLTPALGGHVRLQPGQRRPPMTESAAAARRAQGRVGLRRRRDVRLVRRPHPGGRRRGALDLVMPGPNGPWGAALVAAVRDGPIPESSVDDKVLRLLRLAARVGALSGVAAAVPAVTPWTHEQIAAELRSQPLRPVRPRRATRATSSRSPTTCAPSPSSARTPPPARDPRRRQRHRLPVPHRLPARRHRRRRR